jgi:hypothetical protein
MEAYGGSTSEVARRLIFTLEIVSCSALLVVVVMERLLRPTALE